jgi:hypothetical protein
MNQSDVERAVARATGESRRFIKHFGFSLNAGETESCPDLTLAIDCPGCGAALNPDAALDRLSEVECAHCDAVYPMAVEEVYVANRPRTAPAACA